MKDNVLKKEELIEIIKAIVTEQVEAYVREHEIKAKEFSLLERIIRVEEELKAQREIIASLQREMGVRFEAVDKRFEAMDKRFESLQREMDKRFESVEKRLSFLQWFMAGGFTFISVLITIINFLK